MEETEETIMMSDSCADGFLLRFLSRKLDRASPLPSRSSIYRVPETLRRYNEMAPNLVSIGPFHSGRPRLQAMEEMKMWYLKCLLKQTPDPDNCLVHLVNVIKKHENFCRDCYEERVPLDSDEFVEMMLVDGCFIIELLRKQVHLSPVEDDDAIFRTPRMLLTITNDLLLVENQLPWRVLDCLFEVTRVDDDDRRMPSLRELACHVFQNPTFQQSFESITSLKCEEEFESSHLLETVRNFVVQVQPCVEDWEDMEYRTPIPSVSELLEIGVKFVAALPRDVKDNGQLHITFRNGVMEIPPIIIRQDTESFIRNLIAYEQCLQKPEQCQVTSYAILFSQLIESVQDVDFLFREKL